MSSSTHRTKTSDHHHHQDKKTTEHAHQDKKTSEHAHESKDQSSTHSPHSRKKRSFFTAQSSSIHSNLFGSPVGASRSSESTSRLYARPFEEVLVASADSQSATTNKPTDGSGPATETK